MGSFEKLRELQEMLAKGLISESEFISLKNEIMNNPSGGATTAPSRDVPQQTTQSSEELPISEATRKRFGHYGKILKETQDNVWVSNHRSGKTFKFDKNNPKHGHLERKRSFIGWLSVILTVVGGIIFWRISLYGIILLIVSLPLSIIAFRQDKIKYDNYNAIGYIVFSSVSIVIGFILLVFYYNVFSGDTYLESEVLYSIEQELGEPGVDVLDVDLIRSQGNRYEGIVEINEYGEIYQYDLSVTTDGDEFIWQIN